MAQVFHFVSINVLYSDDIRLAFVAWHSREEDIFSSEKYGVDVRVSRCMDDGHT